MPKQAVLVTGGAKRIGRAISVFLAVKGFDVALHYDSSEKEAKEVKKEIEALGQKCILFKADLNKIEEVKYLIQKSKDSFSVLSLLINNASIFEEGLFIDTDTKQFDRHFNINFKAPFILSQNFAKLFQKGQIINMLDTNIIRKNSKYFAYNLSKKLLYEFTKMSAYELGPRIRVNAIAPGPILPPKGKNKINLNSVPLKKQGDFKNITQAINYLIENSFVTGECLFVDGGKHLIN